MKIHWGYGIWGAYLSFVFGMLGMVYFSTQNFAGLVSKDYYSLDLGYQARLDAIDRTKRLEHKPSITYIKEAKVFKLSITGFELNKVKVHFYKAADAKADQLIEMVSDENGQVILPMHLPEAGMWKAEVSWQKNGLDYYLETPIFI